MKKVHEHADVYLLKSVADDHTIERHRNDLLPIFRSIEMINNADRKEDTKTTKKEGLHVDSEDSESEEETKLPRRSERLKKKAIHTCIEKDAACHDHICIQMAVCYVCILVFIVYVCYSGILSAM